MNYDSSFFFFTKCLPSFQLRVVARDTGTPPLSSQATVDIFVLRNLQIPRFTTNTVISLTIPETTALGSFITKVEAKDDDQFVSFNINVDLLQCYISYINFSLEHCYM